MGKVILCSFSLSFFIIFILDFCFAQTPEKNPSYWDGPWDLSTWWRWSPSATVQCSAGWYGQTTYAIICKCLWSLYPHEREQFSIPRLGGACWCTLGMLRATPDCSVRATQPVPWISYECTMWCPSLPSAEPAGIVLEDNMGLGEPNTVFLALLSFGGESKELMQGMYLKKSPGESCNSAFRGDGWVLRLLPYQCGT